MAAALDVDSTGKPNYFPLLSEDDGLSRVQLSAGAYDGAIAEASVFDVSEYIDALDQLMEESSCAAGGNGSAGICRSPNTVNEEEKIKRMEVKVSERIGFRTMSNVDVLDDGFKWRKYGKKKVKSSPNPRNYYRCTSVGCGVRKRVERDRHDARYVITTYEGVHNHIRPDGRSVVSYKSYHSNSTTTRQAKPHDAWSWMLVQPANLLA